MATISHYRLLSAINLLATVNVKITVTAKEKASKPNHNSCLYIKQNPAMFAQTISTLFQMDDETWKRHTHPWCFWTRLTVIPLLFLAIWSRLWLGWCSIPLVIAAVLWNWLNVRIFPVPKSTHTWIAKGVFGERVWINRTVIPIPQHHQYFPYFLTGLSGIGLILSVWGLWQFDLSLTLIGILLINIGKIWFFDRMVWLYEDMKTVTAEYKSWLY